MPTRTYMIVYARHDHAIRIPRPDLSVALHTPNACANCHAHHSTQWAADQITAWYGTKRRAEAHYGSVIEAARKEKPGAEAALSELVLDKKEPSIMRATALSLLPLFAADIGPMEIEAYRHGLEDHDPLVRMAAVDALQPLPPAQSVTFVAPLLEDKVKAVRIAAARVLAALCSRLPPQQKAAFDRAAAELIAAEEASGERPEAQLSIGGFETDRGPIAEAEAAYRRALKLDPRFAPAMVDMADLYRARHRDFDAGALLRQAILLHPHFAPAYHALGLLLVRVHHLPEALDALKKAMTLAPHNARFAYVYAIALNSAGRAAEAIAVPKHASRQHPAEVEILAALSTISRDNGERAAAIAYAERLAKVAPNNPIGRVLLRSLGNP